MLNIDQSFTVQEFVRKNRTKRIWEIQDELYSLICVLTKAEEKKNNWLAQNQDFFDVINKHATKFVEQYAQVASGLSKIPDEFERQRAAYESIKALGLDKPEKKQSSIQDTITNPKFLVESEASKDWCRGGECTRKQNIDTK
jgi:hypothetical protein